MTSPANRVRSRIWKGLLSLLLLPLFPGSCQRRPQTPAAPPRPNYLEQGDRYFDTGDYPNAIHAYTAYLQQSPRGAQGDRVLYRLGLAFALPANPSRDPVQAVAYLNQLSSSFPQSPLRAEADLLAQLEQEIQGLRSEINEKEQQVGALNQQLQRLQQDELEQLRSDLKNREDRIRQLSDELEKLKAIDMQRRPANPPR